MSSNFSLAALGLFARRSLLAAASVVSTSAAAAFAADQNLQPDASGVCTVTTTIPSGHRETIDCRALEAQIAQLRHELEIARRRGANEAGKVRGLEGQVEQLQKQLETARQAPAPTPPATSFVAGNLPGGSAGLLVMPARTRNSASIGWNTPGVTHVVDLFPIVTAPDPEKPGFNRAIVVALINARLQTDLTALNRIGVDDWHALVNVNPSTQPRNSMGTPEAPGVGPIWPTARIENAGSFNLDGTIFSAYNVMTNWSVVQAGGAEGQKVWDYTVAELGLQQPNLAMLSAALGNPVRTALGDQIPGGMDARILRDIMPPGSPYGRTTLEHGKLAPVLDGYDHVNPSETAPIPTMPNNSEVPTNFLGQLNTQGALLVLCPDSRGAFDQARCIVVRGDEATVVARIAEVKAGVRGSTGLELTVAPVSIPAEASDGYRFLPGSPIWQQPVAVMAGRVKLAH